jgi:NADPH:quinone reductase-like Zn-dependent oxidoreductase
MLAPYHSGNILSGKIHSRKRTLMRAVRLHQNGLRLEELSMPEPREGEALVRVHAAAITRDELTWSADRLPAIPSYELSGTVEATGEPVFALTPFDRDGVAAEYTVVPSALLAPKPTRLSHVEAAALPMGALSAWQALIIHGGLRAGERVCITGAGGNVGQLAAQLARARGATLVAEGEPCDLLFDTSGRAAGQATRIVTIAEETPGADYFIVEPNGEQLAELSHLHLRPEIDSVFPLTAFAAAFERVGARGKHGKVVLNVAEVPPFNDEPFADHPFNKELA